MNITKTNHADSRNKDPGPMPASELRIQSGLSGILPEVSRLSPEELTQFEARIAERLKELSAAISNGEAKLVHEGHGSFAVATTLDAVSFSGRLISNDNYILGLENSVPRRALLNDRVAFFSGFDNTPFSRSVALHCQTELLELKWTQFKDNEIQVLNDNDISGKDAVIIHRLDAPVHEHLLELRLSCSTLRNSRADKITAIFPYLPYSRQDRPESRASSFGAGVIADILSGAVDHIITMDIHSEQTLGLYREGTIENLSATPVFAQYIREHFNLNEVTIVSPDAGGMKRAQKFAREVDAPVAVIHKERLTANHVSSMTLLGEVKGRTCVIVDDMVDTAGTLTKAAEVLKEAGAKAVIACCTHGLFSADAISRINQSLLDRIVTTDTIPLRPGNLEKVVVLSVAPLFAAAILRAQGIRDQLPVQ